MAEVVRGEASMLVDDGATVFISKSAALQGLLEIELQNYICKHMIFY
jgi:hypothetical protein